MKKLFLLTTISLLALGGCTSEDAILQKRIDYTLEFFKDNKYPLGKATYKKLKKLTPEDIKGRHILAYAMLVIRKNKLWMFSWFADTPKADAIRIISKDKKTLDLCLMAEEVQMHRKESKITVSYSSCFNSDYNLLPDLKYQECSVVLLSKGRVISNKVPINVFDDTGETPENKTLDK